MKRRDIEPIAHKATSFAEAEAWDREQLRALTLDERQRIARILRARAFGTDNPDVRKAELGS